MKHPETRRGERNKIPGRDDIDPGKSHTLYEYTDEQIHDPVRLYFDEIYETPLLTREQEVILAKRIERGVNAQKKLDHNNRYRRADRTELEAVIEDGREALDHLILANTRLVVSVAKKYNGRGVPFLDLIQEGNLGLITAAEKFDYRRGYKFSTHATWWIRQAITRAIADKGRTIRIPVHVSENIVKLRQLSNSLQQELGHDLTDQELAIAMNVPLDKIRFFKQIAQQPLSLDQPVVGGDESGIFELSNYHDDDRSLQPSVEAEKESLKKLIQNLLVEFSPREQKVMEMRYGLLDGVEYTLNQVGEKFDITRERVRQIEAKVLRKLRQPKNQRLLKDYAPDRSDYSSYD